jgi:phosphohistidine swiveling domain-containing protein
MNQKDFLNEKWYVQGFNACNTFIAIGPRSALVMMHKFLGYGHTKHLFVFNKDYLEYHYLVKDLENIGETFLSKQRENPLYFDWMISQSKRFEEKLEKYKKNFKKMDLKNIGTPNLIKLFNEVFALVWSHMGYSHALEGIAYVAGPLLEKRLRELLAKKGLENKFKEYFVAMTQPTRPSLLNKENISILKIAKSIKDVDKLSKEEIGKIRKHADEFFWIQMNYYVTDPLTEKDFIGKIKTILQRRTNLSKSITQEENVYKKNTKEKERILKELDNDKELAKLLEITDKNLYWQDDRKKFMLTCVYYTSILIKELAKRYNIPFDAAKQLIPEEVKEEILSRIDKDNLKQRAEKCVCLFYRNQGDMETEILVGKEADKFIRELRKKEAEKIDGLSGSCASTGKATGRARVCKTINDLKEFKEGEILVTSMTRPEFVPAMRKAAAIVTDEGGITCHAAIVARELGIPCVIGTKNATQVLKNNDLVEVNANHGVVKILEKTK